jgi:hypothetical protein
VAVEMETFEDAKSSERDSEPNANNAQASWLLSIFKSLNWCV